MFIRKKVGIIVKNKTFIIIILLTYILVPILIMNNNYLFEIKFYILTIIGILIYILMKLFKISNKELGLTKNNFILSIKRNLPLIILFCTIIIILKLFHVDKYIANETTLFYIFYVFVSCPIQEFLYRGVLGYFEQSSKRKWMWIIISSLCYSFVHIIYKDILTCVLTFIIGYVWYHLYRKDYNLSGVTLSHIVLGILSISLGIVN